MRKAAQKGKESVGTEPGTACPAHSWILFDGGSSEIFKRLFFPVFFRKEIHFHLKGGLN